MNEHVTLLPPDPRGTPRAISAGLPDDLLSQSAERLRVLALLYAFVFFMAGIFPALLVSNDRARFLSTFVQWGPAVIGIAVGLLVAAVIRSPRLPLRAAMTLGLVFEIVSSYAIAASEFADPAALENHRGNLGLSWVAVWVVLFTIVVPTSPRRALLTALASVSSVPVVIGLVIAYGTTSVQVVPAMFFLGLVFPYLLVVGMAYVGARVVYQLGTEVKRARDLGSYRLEEKLGEGGMGEVWRARHRMLARPAAIKLIRPSVAGHARPGVSEEAVRRFEREAQAIASLRSPHTVELFDFGIADGAFYYVMELLDGLDADSLLRRFGPVPPERAVFLLRQVCHSLSEAQSCGLVHRDIKPANIFLCRYGEEYDFVKVLDFGIVGAAPRIPRTRARGSRRKTPSRVRRRSSPPSRRWGPPWTGAPTFMQSAVSPTGYNVQHCNEFIKKSFRSNLSFDEITPEFLTSYENWMLSPISNKIPGKTSRGNSMTTVGIYLRHLRAIYNQGILENSLLRKTIRLGGKNMSSQ